MCFIDNRDIYHMQHQNTHISSLSFTLTTATSASLTLPRISVISTLWSTTVIRFESEVLPHCSCRVRLWNQFHLCFYYVKSQLVLPLACYSSRGSHAALCVMSGAGPASQHRDRERVIDRRIHVKDMRKTNKHANGNYWGWQNYQAHFYLSYDSLIYWLSWQA